MKSDIGFSETRAETIARVDEMLGHLMQRKVLEWLETGCLPGPMSVTEISDFCGVDPMVIIRTEQKALKKMHLRIKNQSIQRKYDL